MPAIHHEQIPRMRISVKESVFEQLLEIRANEHPVDLDWRDAIRAQTLEVNHLRSANEVEREHARVRVRPVNFRHSNRAPGAEVITEPISVTPFPDVVHLFE